MLRRLPKRLWAGLGGLVLLLAFGLILTRILVSYVESQQRQSLLGLVATAKAGLTGEPIGELKGLPADQATASYGIVRAELFHMRQASQQTRFVYLLAMKGGQAVFLADAEPPDSTDFSPPGEVYADASPALIRSFTDGEPFVEGPLEDKWGVWVSGLAPIRDPDSGTIIAVLGMDIDAGDWLGSVAAYRFFGLFLTFVPILIVLLVLFQAWRSERINELLRREIVERKRSEEEVRKLTWAIEQNPASVVITDRQGSIEYANPNFTVLSGLGVEAIQGRDFRTLYAQGTSGLPGGVWEGVLEGRGWQGELVKSGADGLPTWELAFLSPLRTPEGGITHVIVVLEDITKRKETENALRESEERYRTLVDLAPDIIFRIREDGTISFISPAIRQLGYDPQELIGARFESIVHPDDWPKLRDGLVEKRIGDRRTRDVEIRLKVATGRDHRDFTLACWTVSVDARGVWDVPDDQIGRPDKKFLYTQGMAHDITARKEADAVLRKLTRALEQSPAAVLITDREGGIEYVNPKFTEMTGFAPEEVKGQLPRILDSRMHQPEHFRQIWDTILDGRAWHGEFRSSRKNGEQFWISASISPVKNEAEETTHFVAVEEDVSDKRRISAELEDAKQAADAANRAKSAFLANMSHEIRTPLNAIIGFSQLMNRDPALVPRLRESLGAINRSGEHLLALINDILEISKIEAGRSVLAPTPFDLHALLDDMGLMFRLRAEAKGLSLSFRREGTVPRLVVTDVNKLRQVLINLIGNAVKFTDKGRVTVRTSRLPEGAGGMRLRFEVDDTGVGIAEEEMSRLFKHFTQTASGERSGEGTGLGLAISREFVRMMDGDIDVRSEPGEGSTFGFTVSVRETLQEDRDIVPAPRRVVGLLPGQPPCRILIVDDNTYNRKVFSGLLGSVGFATREAAGGEEAVAEFEGWRPDLALVDLRMPGMDGYETIRIIKSSAAGRDTPVIAVSSSAFDEEMRKSKEAGAAAFISKPCREEELFETVARYLRVDYSYAAEAPRTGAAMTGDEARSLSRDFMKGLPESLKSEVRDASINADPERLHALIGKMGAGDERIPVELHRLVDAFQYGILCELVGGAESPRPERGTAPAKEDPDG